MLPLLPGNVPSLLRLAIPVHASPFTAHSAPQPVSAPARNAEATLARTTHLSPLPSPAEGVCRGANPAWPAAAARACGVNPAAAAGARHPRAWVGGRARSRGRGLAWPHCPSQTRCQVEALWVVTLSGSGASCVFLTFQNRMCLIGSLHSLNLTMVVLGNRLVKNPGTLMNHFCCCF